MAKLKDMAIKVAGDRYIFELDVVHEMPGYNRRDMECEETQAHIRRIADVIKADGTSAIADITVFQEDGKIYVQAGHCRLRAHKLALAEGAPVQGIRAVAAAKMDEANRLVDIYGSNDSLALPPLKRAEIIGDLVNKFEWSPADVAARLGVSVTDIKDKLKLVEAPETVKEMVRNGEVAARTATDVISKHGADQGTETLKRAVQVAKDKGKDKATPKDVKEVAPEKPKTPEKETPAPTPDAATKTAPAPAGNKDAGKVTPLPKPGVNFEKHGPTMLKFMKAIRDVPNMARLQELQSQVGALIKGFEK